MGTIVQEYLSDSGVLYEVKVTYGPEANIPEGARLKITEFAEDSSDYDYARRAVLADKLAKGKEIDLFDFNLAALDISILDADGNEIEPEATVQVDIKIKALPGVEDLSEVVDTLEIQHHVETENGVVVERVSDAAINASFQQKTDAEIIDAKGDTTVDPDSVDEDALLAEMEEASNGYEVSFTTEKFSTYTISWNYGYRNAVIHYGYLSGGTTGTFVEFDSQPAPVQNTTNYRRHLIYDFDGYQYYRTYFSTNETNNPTSATRIGPLLRYSNNNWQYRTYTSTGNNNSWQNITSSNGTRHIYVVYQGKNPTEGGSVAPAEEETWPEGADAPQFSKSSTNNGNGTNTISLGIKAGEKPVEHETKANIIVIFDRSGSMTQNLNGQTRLQRAKTAINRLAQNMMTGDKAGQVKMALVSFADTVSLDQGLTDNYSTYTGKVNAISAGGGTNWEGALDMANSIAVEQDAATFVVFVTDGDPTVRTSRGNITDQQLNSEADSWANRDVDDGDAYYVRDGIYGTGTHDNFGRNYDYALDAVKAIKAKNKNFYAIGVSADVTKVEKLVTDAGIASDHAFLATNSTKLDEAFEKIVESIKSELGFGDVEITDGITAMTHAEMKVMQTVDPNSFKYYRYGGENNKYGNGYANKTEWTTRAADGCGAATYTESDGAVHWDMGESFQLEDGVTYVVEFTVWPSQDAYDLVADLNNGVKRYSTLEPEEKAQIVEMQAPGVDEDGNIVSPGVYQLKTNTEDVNAKYKRTTKSGDVVSISDETEYSANVTKHVENMNLATQLVTIKKIFDQSLDPRTVESVTLKLQRKINDNSHTMADYNVPGTESPNIVLSEANNWQYSFYAAPGFILDGEILEKGYQYTVTEPDLGENTVRYDLIPEIVNPMVVNGELQLIGDGDNNNALTAINRTRSAVEIHKTLYDVDGTTEIYPDTEFTITGRLHGPDGQPFTSPETAAPVAYYLYDKDGNATTGRMHFPTTADISFTLKAGEFIRFVNVPEGCTFEFTESSIPANYELESLAAVGRQRNPETDPAYTYSIILDDAVAHLVEGETTISTTSAGIIGNTNYKLDFYNKRVIPLPDVELVKVDKDDRTKKLNGAKFELHKDSATGTLVTKDGNGNEINIVTDNKENSQGPDGWYHIGLLPAGTYYMVETQEPIGYLGDDTPVIITVTQDGETYNITATKEDASVISSPTDGLYTITVDNTYNITEVDATKEWENADGSDTPPPVQA